MSVIACKPTDWTVSNKGSLIFSIYSSGWFSEAMKFKSIRDLGHASLYKLNKHNLGQIEGLTLRDPSAKLVLVWPPIMFLMSLSVEPRGSFGLDGNARLLVS